MAQQRLFLFFSFRLSVINMFSGKGPAVLWHPSTTNTPSCNTFSHMWPLFEALHVQERTSLPLQKTAPPTSTNHSVPFRCISYGNHVIPQHQFTVLNKSLHRMCVQMLSRVSSVKTSSGEAPKGCNKTET